MSVVEAAISKRQWTLVSSIDKQEAMGDKNEASIGLHLAGDAQVIAARGVVATLRRLERHQEPKVLSDVIAVLH